MHASKFRAWNGLELRELKAVDSEASPTRSRLIRQMVGLLLGQADISDEGASLQAVFLKNPERLGQFRQAFSEASLLALYTLETETDAAVLAHHLMAWTRRNIEPARLNLALDLYQSWVASPIAELSILAQSRRDLILGRGAWVETAVHRLGKVSQAFGDPVLLAGFALSGGVYSAARAFVLPRILTTGAGAPAVGFVAAGVATVPEALAFGGFMDLGRQFFYGEKTNWSWGYFRNLLTSFWTFKVTGAVATSASQWAAQAERISGAGFFGRTFLDLTKAVAPSLGTYGGIVLAHGTQEVLGWNPVEVGANLWFDSAVFFIHLRFGGALSQNVFSKSYALSESWNHRLQDRMRLQEKFMEKSPSDPVAVTDNGIAMPIPERGPPNSRLAVFSQGEPREAELEFGEDGEKDNLYKVRRERALELRQGLGESAEEAERLWEAFNARLTVGEAKALNALLAYPEIGSFRRLAKPAGVGFNLIHRIPDILSRLEDFVKNHDKILKSTRPKNRVKFIPEKRARILELKRGLDKSQEDARDLWKAFTARLNRGQNMLLKVLLKHPEEEDLEKLAAAAGISLSTSLNYIPELWVRLEKFIQDPQKFMRNYPINARIGPVQAKRKRILELKRGLASDALKASRLWERFQESLIEAQRVALEDIMRHSSVTTFEALAELSELNERTLWDYSKLIIARLEEFTRAVKDDLGGKFNGR